MEDDIIMYKKAWNEKYHNSTIVEINTIDIFF